MFPPESYPNRVYVKVLDVLNSETDLGVEVMTLEVRFKAR
jgi:hypothetical protein